MAYNPLRSPTTRFVGLFGALAAAGLLLLQLPIAGRVLWPLKLAFASAMGAGLRLFGHHAAVSGTDVLFADRAVVIIDECTGIYAAILLTSFIVAFPKPWKAKIRAELLALVFIAVVNVGRLVALGLLMVHTPEFAEFAHDYLWQVVWGAALVGFVMVFAMKGEPSRRTRATT